MKEHIDLIREWRESGAGAELALATVVATRGSVYRKPGARMLLSRDRWLAGSISGGCVESDLLRTAWERTESGPERITYDASSPEDAILGLGLGCSGVAEVLLERLSPDGGPLVTIEEVLRSRLPAELFTCITPGPLLGCRWKGREELPEGVDYLYERILPPPSVVIFGAGHDAIPLAHLAKNLGWHVTVADVRSAYATRERFPQADRLAVTPPAKFLHENLIEADASVVIMTHSYLQDLELLKAIGPIHRGYLGLLGPRVRTERLLADAKIELPHIHAPIGLDLGAEGPDEIALSIVAEILSASKGKTGASFSQNGSRSSVVIHEKV